MCQTGGVSGTAFANTPPRGSTKTSSRGSRGVRYGNNKEDRSRDFSAQGDTQGGGTATIERTETEARQVSGGSDGGGTATIERTEAEAMQLKGYWGAVR